MSTGNNCKVVRGIKYAASNIPANTKHLYNICATSVQRLRRWSNILQMLYNFFVFTGIALVGFWRWTVDVIYVYNNFEVEHILLLDIESDVCSGSHGISVGKT